MNKKIKYDFDTIVSRAGTQSEKYEALERFYGRSDIEPFWVADMDLPSPSWLADALNHRVSHPIYGYTEKNKEIFNSIKWWMENEHNVSIHHDNISLSPSVVTTMSMAIQAFSDTNDNIILFSPVYGPFFTTIKSHNRGLIDCPLIVEDNTFKINFELFEKKIITHKVKILLLCNPQNPGGRVWKKSELIQIVKICRKYNVIIFSDEIHSDIVFLPAKHTSILSIEEAKDICVMAHSIGKTFNTSGLKSSFSIVPNLTIRNKLRKQHRLSHTDNINLFGKIAIEKLFSLEGSEYKRQLLSYLRINTDLVYQKLSNIPTLQPMLPEATFLVWCDFRQISDWRDVSRILINDAKIALSGGSFFGPSGEGWFRINCGHAKNQLLPAVDRLCNIFKD